MKSCPFKMEECGVQCGLFIEKNELNETVRNRLNSLGILGENEGVCSLKNIALCADRYVFENSNTTRNA